MPWSVPEGIIHGCNTPCIEVYDDRNEGILILDAGSGIVGVQPSLMCKGPRPVALALTVGVVFAGLIGAIGWNLTTFYLGLPTSSSHALVGGMAGAAVSFFGFSAIRASLV